MIHSDSRWLEIDEERFDAEATRIGERLLRDAALVAGGVAHRIAEVELYYFGDRHRDPFAHRDPAQLEPGRWYFHKSGQSYRGGSFKGLDLSLGRRGTWGGALIRSVRGPDGALVSGPSLVVDHLLRLTGLPDVASLAARADALLQLQPAAPVPSSILRTARVGLTLKRFEDAKPAYLMRPDRFLNAPAEIKKGRVHTVVALHKAGLDTPAIKRRTGSPGRTIERYLSRYEEGRARGRFQSFVGKSLSPLDLAALHGVWEARFGGS